MKTEAIVVRAHGDPEVLTREEVDIGEPGPREVAVRVRAVGVNHLDLWVRRGLPHIKLQYPHRLGSDVVGEIAALGPGARGVSVGDRVVVNPGLSCGRCGACLAGRDNLCPAYAILGEHTSGGYAQHVIVPDQNLWPAPEGRAPTELAAVPLVFMTAWQMLVVKGQVGPNMTVLVHAAGSGVSSAAIQIAKLFGAIVIATTRRADKVARARELGADHVIHTAAADFVTEARRLTGKRGVDLILDHVGGDVLSRSVLAAARGGRIVTCGATAGLFAEIDLRHIFFRQVELLGSTMASKSVLPKVLDLVARGRLQPVVDRVLPLASAAEAHRALEAGDVFGKIVLEVH